MQNRWTDDDNGGLRVFSHIGAGCEEPLHSSAFLPDDDVAIKLGGMHAAVVLRYLNKIKPLIEEVSGETAVIDL